MLISLFSAYQEDDGPASLLFDLPTLRHATDNFAEENKLGHGGFGAVYKVGYSHIYTLSLLENLNKMQRRNIFLKLDVEKIYGYLFT
jgi:hypothetical protein